MQIKKGIFITLNSDEFRELGEKIKITKPQIVGVQIDGQTFRGKALELCSETELLVQADVTDQWPQIKNELTFNLVFNENRYLFKSFASLQASTSEKYKLKLTTPIHRVHRRLQQRLAIPEDYNAVLKFQSPANISGIKSMARVLNISPTGCRIEVTGESDLIGKDKFEGEILFPSHLPVIVECKVIHRKLEQLPEGKKKYIMGLKYQFSESKSIEPIKTLVDEIYQDIFSKYQKVS